MEICCTQSTPHSQLTDALFMHKKKVSRIFQDVLGIHGIHHLSVTRVNSHNKLLIFSSTPAMEFNLFNSLLWQFDNTYNPEWFKRCIHSAWQMLYSPARYDELYYLRQIKHRFPIAVSMAAKTADEYFIYSMASKTDTPVTQELFTNEIETFYRIGHYCSNQLLPLFAEVEQPSPQLTGDQ